MNLHLLDLHCIIFFIQKLRSLTLKGRVGANLELLIESAFEMCTVHTYVTFYNQ